MIISTNYDPQKSLLLIMSLPVTVSTQAPFLSPLALSSSRPQPASCQQPAVHSDLPPDSSLRQVVFFLSVAIKNMISKWGDKQVIKSRGWFKFDWNGFLIKANDKNIIKLVDGSNYVGMNFFVKLS